LSALLGACLLVPCHGVRAESSLEEARAAVKADASISEALRG